MALFAALIAISGFLIIPLPGGIPIVLKNLFIVLSGTVLGGFYGFIAVLIFLCAGLLGLPVFVIPGGPGVFLTPLGGYIIGYCFASLAAGLISGIPSQKASGDSKIALAKYYLRVSAASLAGFSLILLCGALYLIPLNSLSLKAALIAGTLPFIPVDLIKLAISIPLAIKLRPIAARYINPMGGEKGTPHA